MKISSYDLFNLFYTEVILIQYFSRFPAIGKDFSEIRELQRE